jgi:hypothetical protein
MKLITRIAVLFAFLASPLLAQESVVDQIVKEGRENCEVMKHLDHLTNKIGPRLTSSDNLTKAQEWAKEQFEKWGLKNCRLEEWGTFPVGFNRGPWSGKMTAPEEKELVCATMSWTAGTDGPVEGPAFTCPKNADEIQALGAKIRGAWLVVTGRPPADVMSDCEKAGAAGFVRSSGGELIVTGGNHGIRWDNLPKRVTVIVRGDQHKAIVAHLDAKTEVKLRFDIKNEFKQGPIKLYNVIAEIPGTDKPDEVVVVGGHIDSWDGATGCTDNGTGTCTTLEAARILAKVGAKPKRTIRFMLWSGEEQGLFGSRGWIKNHKDELAKISAVLVHDGGTNYVSGIAATEAMVPIFEKLFAPVMKLNEDLPFRINKVKSLPMGIGSDHDSFLQNGVPGFFWNQSRTKAKGQNYTHEHHTQYDVYSAAVPEFQQHTSMVVAIGALGVANLDKMLPRDGVGRAAPAPSEEPPRRMLGVNCDDDMVITNIVEESAAEAAGLREGDKILKIGDKDVSDLDSLRAAIKAAAKETVVEITRDGKKVAVHVKFKQ